MRQRFPQLSVIFTTIALALNLAGCTAGEPTMARSDTDVALFGPVAMRLHPIFTQVKDWSGDNKPDGIEALLELQDQFGDPTKASGRVRFELFDYKPYDPNRHGDRIARWDGYLETLDEQRDRWNRTSSTYAFQLAYPALGATKSYVLNAQFDLTNGGRFFAELILEGQLPQTNPLDLPPTTQPTTRSTTAPAEPMQPGSPPVLAPGNEPANTPAKSAAVSSSSTSKDALLARTRAELTAQFDLARPHFIHSASGSIDVMGGISEFTGSPVVRAKIDAAASAIVQSRLNDRDIQIFSFDEFDAHRPFMLRVPIDALFLDDDATLRRALNEPGRSWAAAVIDALVIHRAKFSDPSLLGLSIAISNQIPRQKGSGAVAAAFAATERAIAQSLGNSGSTFQSGVASMLNGNDSRDCTAAMIAASRDDSPIIFLAAPVATSMTLPPNVQLIALDATTSDASKLDSIRALERSARDEHERILDHMREFGRRANRELLADPMNGFLSNLDPDDYKQFFRPALPESARHIADHFVLEPRRVREFVRALEQAPAAPPRTREAGKWLDRAGHLMYASDFSYRHDAKISSPECEFLVDAIHAREKAGIYGARLTGNGAADGIVVILADESPTVDAAIEQIADAFLTRFGKPLQQIKFADRKV